MFKARTLRTFLTILGMSIGIGAILFLVSMGYGLQKTILEKITTSDSLLTLDVSQESETSNPLDMAALEKIKTMPQVREVSPSAQVRSQAKISDITTDVSSNIVSPNYMRLGGLNPTAGKILNDDDKDGVVISTSVAQIFGKSEAEVIGQEMSLVFFLTPDEGKESHFDVLGVDPKNTGQYIPIHTFKVVGVKDTEDNVVFVNASSVESLRVNQYDQVKVKCSSEKDIAYVRDQLIGQGFLVSSISETVDQTNKIFNVVKIVLMLFGIIALVVSAIGMFNTMTITLLERTEEIGIMKSIGASDMTISLIFIMESTIMGFMGGLVGIMIGWLEGSTFNAVVNLIATHFGGPRVDLFYSPTWFVLSIIIFSAFVGFITGVIPARRASRIDPLEALRYK
jgi:ABC-type antimicrobial peptide transport system permease subunit